MTKPADTAPAAADKAPAAGNEPNPADEPVEAETVDAPKVPVGTGVSPELRR